MKRPAIAFVFIYMMGSRLTKCVLVLILLGVMLAPARPAAKAESGYRSTFTMTLSDGTPVELYFSALPELSGCQPLVSGDDEQLWSCSDYVLRMQISRGTTADLISFKLENPDGIPFNLHENGVRAIVPESDGDALWTFNRLAVRDIMETNLGRSWEFYSAANSGIPYIALVDLEGSTKLSLGLLAQDHSVITSGESADDAGGYALTLRQADDAASNSFSGTYYVSRARDHWFRNAQLYTEAVDSARAYAPPRPPDAALNATYDSWYWTLDRIDRNMTLDLAERSSALGFKTYLIDAGWDTRAGEYVKGLKGSTGDYIPPPDAFPDFPGLLDDIRSRLGMKVMLWMQQYNLGRRSVYYPQFGSALCRIGDPESGDLSPTQFLCPNTYATRRHLADLFNRILEKYRPDALWFDLQESIPQICAAPHIHEFDRFGEGYNAAQQTIMDAIQQHSPDIFVDMRWPFANLNNKPYLHIWQPTDSPSDFEAMRLRALVMRPFSAGVVTGTDEMYWDPGVSDTEAARYMAATVFSGIPYFGPNLQAESDRRTEMLKAWVGFYEANREDLVYGKFFPYGDRDRPDQWIAGSQTAFIYYGNRYPGIVYLDGSAEKIYIANASESSGIDLTLSGLKAGRYRAEISDSDLVNRRPALTRTLLPWSRLRYEVPVGCLLTLTHLE